MMKYFKLLMSILCAYFSCCQATVLSQQINAAQLEQLFNKGVEAKGNEYLFIKNNLMSSGNMEQLKLVCKKIIDDQNVKVVDKLLANILLEQLMKTEQIKAWTNFNPFDDKYQKEWPNEIKPYNANLFTKWELMVIDNFYAENECPFYIIEYFWKISEQNEDYLRTKELYVFKKQFINGYDNLNIQMQSMLFALVDNMSTTNLNKLPWSLLLKLKKQDGFSLAVKCIQAKINGEEGNEYIDYYLTYLLPLTHKENIPQVKELLKNNLWDNEDNINIKECYEQYVEYLEKNKKLDDLWILNFIGHIPHFSSDEEWKDYLNFLYSLDQELKNRLILKRSPIARLELTPKKKPMKK